MKKFHNLAICILWACCAALAEGTCPQWDDDNPCTCDGTSSKMKVHCTGQDQNQQVLTALQSVQTSSSWDLSLDSVVLEELPANIKSVSSLRLKNCAVTRLLKTTPLVWPNLHEVMFETVRIDNIPWPQLKGAGILNTLIINDFSMVRTLGQDFRKLPESIEWIDLSMMGTTELESGCMAHLKNLVYISMTDMPITEFPRNALPAQVPHLHTFILGNTLIETLQPNFFDGMPNLRVLMLTHNKFTSLDSKLFMPLRSHLNILTAESNPLKCDCNLLWLKKSFQRKRSIKVIATCYDNSVQEYIAVMKLEESQYCS